MDEDEKLIALAKSLKLTGANNTDAALSKRLIVDAMVSGRVIVNLQKKVSAPPKAEELLPGPITAPPIQESAPLIPRFLADPENSLKLAAQSATLTNASEKASTFCGQCEKEGCKAAGAETKPEEVNTDTGDADTGDNDKVTATTNTDTAETAEPTETLKTEPVTQPEATADTAPDATTETDGDIADTNPANTPDSPITTDDIPDVNPDKIIPTENITPSTPDNPLTGTTGGINGNIPDSIPASTNVTTASAASANKGTAAIAAASTAASAAAALSDGDSAASALADTPNANEYSDYPEDYPETPEPTENTSSLGDSTEPDKTLNTNTAEQATSQTAGQTPDPASPIDTPETTPTTTNTEAVNTKTTDTINSADNSIETPETLTTGNVDTGSVIDASSIATGAAATAAAAASPLIAKVSSAKDSKTTGQLNEKSGKILAEGVDNVGAKDEVRKQQEADNIVQKELVSTNITQYGTTLESEINTLKKFGANKSSIQADINTKSEFSTLSPQIANNNIPLISAFSLWKKQDWQKLEGIFPANEWPPYRGFITRTKGTLEVNTQFDRFGGRFKNGIFSDRGSFVSPVNTSFTSRGLPESTLNAPKSAYEVLKPIKGQQGPAIPWFEQEGLGIQWEMNNNIDYLLKNNYIRLISRSTQGQ